MICARSLMASSFESGTQNRQERNGDGIYGMRFAFAGGSDGGTAGHSPRHTRSAGALAVSGAR
jgi:hypothetical protein